MSVFSQKEKDTLLNLAHETLETYLKTRKIAPLTVDEDTFPKKAALFIKLYAYGEIRGKAGIFEEKDPLIQVLQTMVIQAAAGDPSTLPIQSGELKNIQIEIIYLYDFKPLKDMADIELGKHGLYLVVENKSGYVFAKEALQNKWNVGEFLGIVGQKAGLPAQAWQFKNAKVQTFQTEIISDMGLHQSQANAQRYR